MDSDEQRALAFISRSCCSMRMSCQLCLHKTPSIWPWLSISPVTNLVWAHLWSELPSSCPWTESPTSSTPPSIWSQQGSFLTVLQTFQASSQLRTLAFVLREMLFCQMPVRLLDPFPHVSTPKSHLSSSTYLATRTWKSTLHTDMSHLPLWFFFSLTHHYLIYLFYWTFKNLVCVYPHQHISAMIPSVQNGAPHRVDNKYTIVKEMEEIIKVHSGNSCIH